VSAALSSYDTISWSNRRGGERKSRAADR